MNCIVAKLQTVTLKHSFSLGLLFSFDISNKNFRLYNYHGQIVVINLFNVERWEEFRDKN
jgi:hypothetical protein